MERVSLFSDGTNRFAPAESEIPDFQKEMDGEPVREVKRFRDEQGQKYEVPLDELDAFTQEMAGTKLERVNQVKAGGQLFEVPESEAGEFMDFYNSDDQFEDERRKSAIEAASKLDAPDSPFMAGVKGFFSGEMYAEKASAAAANVFRGVAQAPATIADKVMAAEQFQSRIRNLPVIGRAVGANPMLNPATMIGPAAEAVTEIFKGAKDDGKTWREMVGKARTYIDDWREKNLGFRNEQGEAATEPGDWLLTLGGQAANSVTEAYALSAPSFMQQANKAISFGKFSPTIQTILYGASTAEDTAGKAENAGRSEAEAVALGALTGTLESALESVAQVFGLQKTMGAEPIKKALGRMILRRAMDSVGEGATEGVQEFQKGAIEKLSKIDEKTWGEIGMQSAQAAAAGLLSGGAAEISQASLAGIDTLQQRRQVNELRADEEAAAVGLGRVAQQESVLEGDAAAAPQGEGAFQGQGPVAGEPIGDPRQGEADPTPRQGEADPMQGEAAATPRQGEAAPETGAGLEDGLVEMPADFRTAGERMAQAQPLDLGRGVQAQGIVRIGRKDGKGKGIESVKLLLPNGRPFYSEDPGLMALTRYWYQDRVLFPPSPAGDRGAQEGDTRMNASRRAGFEIPPGKRVKVNMGRSTVPYSATIVDVIDNNTVRVYVDKTQRSKDNNKQGYREVDVRQMTQFPSVTGKANKAKLTENMSPERQAQIKADEKAFDDEIIQAGIFIDQEGYIDAESLKGTWRGSKKMKDEMGNAYARVSQMLGIPLETHVQRAKALPLLRKLHEQALGSEGMPYDAWQDQLAREAEQEMQDRRASGEFSLADMTPEEMAAADANLEAQRVAQDARRKMLARAAAPLKGDAGDLTGELFGAFDDTPLFGGAADAAGNLKLETGNTDNDSNTWEYLSSLLIEEAKEHDSSASDWASRQYKKNATEIELLGDGPKRRETLTVTEANESRRVRNIKSHRESAKMLRSLASRNKVQLRSDVKNAIENAENQKLRLYKNKQITVDEIADDILREEWLGVSSSRSNIGTISRIRELFAKQIQGEDALVKAEEKRIASMTDTERGDEFLNSLLNGFGNNSSQVDDSRPTDELFNTDMAVTARAAAPLEGDAGDLTGELFGAFDDTPLFGGAQDSLTGQDELANIDTMTADEATRDISAESIAQRDAEYLDAVKRGDINKAQALVNQSAEEAITEVIETAKQSFDYVGVRTTDDSENNNSKVWVDEKPTDESLNGASTTDSESNWVGYHILRDTSGSGFYVGKFIKVLASNESQPGEDVGERLLKNPTVIAVFTSPRQTILLDETGKVIPLSLRFPSFNKTSTEEGALANMDIPSQAKGLAYNQEESGGADTPRAQQERAPMTGGGLDGRYAMGMDLMDAVQMFYALRGKLPKIRERMREGVMGLFKPGTQDIELLAGIFGMYDQADSDRIRAALEKKGFTGAKLEAQTDIEVRALIEKRRTENMKKPLKVMVHELSHYLDFLPDSIVRERGNILGHIAALKKHFKQAIGPEPGAPGPLTDAEKARIRTSAESEMKKKLGEARVEIDTITREVPEYAVLGIKPEDVKGLLGIDGRTETPELYDWFSRQDSATKRQVLMAAMKGVIDERMAALGSRVQVGTKTVTEQVARNVKGYTKEDGRKRFRELLAEETRKRRLIELEQIKTEAYQIIPWWRGTPGIENYFTKPEEMYAELFGIFLADPAELQRRAPTVFRAFAGWMDARPEVAQAYREYLDFRNLPAEKQAAQKILNFKRGMEKGDEAERRDATELARKPGRWAGLDSFGYYFHRRTAPIKWALDRSLRVLVDAAQGDTAKAQVRDIYETALVGIKKQSAISRVIQNYEADINARVADPLAQNGFDMLDLGVYQALRRVVYELDGKAAPAGVEPASALKLLASMEAEYGPKKWKVLQEAALEFRRIREARIISNPDLRAMYDKKLLEKLDNNVEYVTFQRVPTMEEVKAFKEALRKAKSGDKLLREDVADFLTREMESRLGSAVGAKIYRFVGSFGPIANPIVATLSKDDQLIRAATRNTLKRQIYEFVKESGLDLIRDVQYEKSGQGVQVPRMVDDPNWKTVVYMQDGQVKGFLANRNLAKALETGRTDEIVALRRAMRINAFITKTYTQLKYSFSFMNNIRDLERAANYVPGMRRMNLGGLNINFVPGGGMISTLMRYGIPQAAARKILPKFMFNDKMIEWHLPQARRAAILIQNNTINQAEAQAQELLRMGETQQANKLFDDVRLAREGLNNPILMSHIEAIREDSQADDYQRRLYKYGIQKEDLGNGLKAAAYLTGLFKGGARRVEAWGEVGELTTKLATWKYLETHGQGMSQQQKILTTRELGGSPDFSERGAAASYIEAITSPFVNAAKEGTLGTLTALKNNPGETSRKLLTNVVAPTMVRHLLGSGLGLALLKIAIPDDDEREGMWLYQFMAWYYNAMKNVPNYIMKNYHSYPVPVKMGEGSNFTAVLRMPMDQTSQVLSLSVWNAMDALGEGLLNQLNSGNQNAAPAVIGRTERPGLETAKAFISAVGPDALGQAPILGMAGLAIGFFFGSNFYDSFKESDVFNEDELIARYSKPNAGKVFLGEVSNRLGGAMVKRYNSGNIFGEELPTLGKLLNAPMIQPTVGTFFNVYTGGQAQMERRLKRIEKEFEAPVKVDVKNDFARALKEGNGKGLNISDDIAAKMTAKEGGTYADLVKAQLYAEEFSRLNQEWQRNKAIRENVGVPVYNAAKEDNPIMRDIRIDIMDRAPVRPILD